MLHRYFPDKKIYSVLGNHEAFPIDSFPSNKISPIISNQWLYEVFGDVNKDFLDEEALRTIRLGGYYTVKLYNNLRLIALNTNFCDKNNFWMIIDDVDPNHQLKWLINILKEAENIGEKVHIIGHHPPGNSDCIKIWSLNLNKIFSRFSNIISGFFFGHTHMDEFSLRFDSDTAMELENIIYVNPSITTYLNLNPAFQVYDVDDSTTGTYFVVNSTIYSLDISNPNSEWSMYSPFQAKYNMPDLSPKSYLNFVLSMAHNDTLYKIFNGNRYRSKFAEEHDKAKILCNLMTSVNGDVRACKRLL